MGGGSSRRKQQAPNDGRVKYRDILTRGKVTDQYRPGRQLGAGNMATVYLYTRLSDNKPFAAKIVEKNTLTDQREFTNELEILAHLRGHNHILQFKDVFEDKHKYFLITDLVAGGELFDRICNFGSYTEGMAKKMILPMLHALQFIHEKQIVHRDIKPENLLLMDDSPDAPLKIADFGVACWLQQLGKGPNKYLKCGTPEYMAPEMYQSRFAPYNIGVDVWAMGCVVYIMLCGWHPFQDQENLDSQRHNILHDNLSSLDEEEISHKAKDFIRRLLDKDPNTRWSIPQILQHPWLEANASVDAKSLSKQHEKLKHFQHLRRLRKVSFAVLAATRASKIVQMTKSSSSDGPKSHKTVPA